MSTDVSQRVYSNAGNPAIVALVDRAAKVVLDVGCGAGDTAALLRARDPHKQIFGITASPDEATLAGQHMQGCWVGDLESAVPEAVAARHYDAIIAAHVLEHTRDPSAVLKRLAALLAPGGSLVVAVPNVLSWRQRWLFLRGRFEYQESGPLDETHLRFFTYHTAERYLFAATPELRVVHKSVTGNVPLWGLRRHLLPAGARSAIDDWGCRAHPNLFGNEILISAIKPGQPSA